MSYGADDDDVHALQSLYVAEKLDPEKGGDMHDVWGSFNLQSRYVPVSYYETREVLSTLSLRITNHCVYMSL